MSQFFIAFVDELEKLAKKKKKSETTVELTQRQLQQVLDAVHGKAQDKLREAGTVEGRRKIMMRRMMWGG